MADSDDLTELEKKIASGVLGTRHGDTSVQLQTTDQLIRAADRLKRKIVGRRRFRLGYQRGKGL